MKTSRIVSLLALVGILSVSSCSKKSDDITPGQTQTPSQTQGGFRVKIDGKEYAPDFSYALTNFPGANNYYAVYGLDSKTNDVMALALPNTAGEGTHAVNVSNGVFATMSYGKEEFSTINGGAGTITITKKTATNIVGTFSFTAYDPTGAKKRMLTEGTFNVNVRQ